MIASIRGAFERASFVALVVSLGVASPASAAVDTAPLVRPVAAFAATFNVLGAYPATAFTSDCHVLDAFPPYDWSGAGAPRRWYASLVGATPAERRAIAATHPHIVFGTPAFARAAGSRAYLVVPGTVTFTIGGTIETQHGRWALVEVRTPQGWRIASQAWAILDGFADE